MEQEFKKGIMANNTEYLKYINTVLLAIIMSLSVLAFAKIGAIHNSQEADSKVLIEVTTNQVAVMRKVDDLDARVKVLEINYMNEIKTWVDANYVRKPQK